MIPDPTNQSEERRSFFRWMALSLGGLIGMIPGVSGAIVLLDPLLRRKKSEGQDFQRVTALDALQVDAPRRFTLDGVTTDAWNQFKTDLGAIYLVRRPDQDGQPVIDAFQVICPHAGCSVVYEESATWFQCPCHESAFDIHGAIVPRPGRSTPAARGLDKMPVRVENGEVFVLFQKFKDGNGTESIPLS